MTEFGIADKLYGHIIIHKYTLKDNNNVVEKVLYAGGNLRQTEPGQWQHGVKFR